MSLVLKFTSECDSILSRKSSSLQEIIHSAEISLTISCEVSCRSSDTSFQMNPCGVEDRIRTVKNLKGVARLPSRSFYTSTSERSGPLFTRTLAAPPNTST